MSYKFGPGEDGQTEEASQEQATETSTDSAEESEPMEDWYFELVAGRAGECDADWD